MCDSIADGRRQLTSKTRDIAILQSKRFRNLLHGRLSPYRQRPTATEYANSFDNQNLARAHQIIERRQYRPFPGHPVHGQVFCVTIVGASIDIEDKPEQQTARAHKRLRYARGCSWRSRAGHQISLRNFRPNHNFQAKQLPHFQGLFQL